jgi:hypothetical protein
MIMKPIRSLSGKLGRASLASYKRVRNFEKMIKDADLYYTGGVAGNIYRATPLYGQIEPVRNLVKTALKSTSQIGIGIEQGKPRQIFSGLSPIVDELDAGGSQQLLKNLIYNPSVQGIYNSPFIQSKLD